MNEEQQKTNAWAAEKFGLAPEQVTWYNQGICYDRIIVTSEEAAKKVSKAVEGETVNGGMLHGMPLGHYSKTPDGNFEVYC